MRHLILLLTALTWAFAANAAEPAPGEEYVPLAAAMGIELPAPVAQTAPTRGQGPFKTLLIRNVMLISGEGAPPQGPLAIEIVGDRINRVGNAAFWDYGEAEVEVIDGTGMYALPGFVDAHVHLGNPLQGLTGAITPPEYVFKLWLAHGITTVRDVGALMGLEWTLDHKQRSDQGEIAAPRMRVYPMFPGGTIVDAAGARQWLRAVRRKGADGVKIRSATRAASEALYAEAQALGIGTANHHDQTSVYHTNVLDSARLGLESMEHWYGLPEALLTGTTVQDYPADYNYSDEQWRFGEAGKLWMQAAAPGSEKWNAVRDELISLDFTLVPTFTIYEANRDVDRARLAPWHEDYTFPALRRFFEPDPRLHGSYHFDWTTEHEVSWRENYARWMAFVNDYKNQGGRVAAGSDAGFIFKLFGFAFIRELEMLQEAGFHPLEVVQAATLNGAELLGIEDEIGSIVPGKRADIVLVEENPLANFKVLYGTGHRRLNRSTNAMEVVGGVHTVIKDGIAYDAKALLTDVRNIVKDAKQQEQAQP